MSIFNFKLSDGLIKAYYYLANLTFLVQGVWLVDTKLELLLSKSEFSLLRIRSVFNSFFLFFRETVTMYCYNLFTEELTQMF
jgi:hypothetical protein